MERAESRKRKAQHHATKQRQQHKRPAQEELVDVPAVKKPRVPAQPPNTTAFHPQPKKKTALQKLVGGSSRRSTLPGTPEGDKDDAYIRYLEGKLGWKWEGAKTSAYGSGLTDDGLDGMCMPPAFYRST